MDEFEKRRLIYQVAQMYYQNNLTQAEIAKRMKLSKPTISRLLAEARQRKYVEIVLHYPYQNDEPLERALLNHYSLQDARVLVANGLSPAEVQNGVGVFAAELLGKYLRNGMILAISRGTNVYSTVKAISPRPDLHLTVVQIQGALGDKLDDGSDLALFLSRLYAADVRLLHAPLILESAATAQTLRNDPSIKSTLDLAKQADIALLGIGTIEPEAFSLYRHGILSLAEVEALKAQGVVGDIAGCFFDENGRELDIEFNRRLVRVTLEDVRHIPIRIGVGCGLARLKAIRAALRAQLINVLATDSGVATRLLEG